jgi:hypothetical protein
MTEEEARQVIKSCGYAWKLHKRRHGLLYIYGQRKEGKQVKQRYIAPLSKLGALTAQDIIRKLTTEGR